MTQPILHGLVLAFGLILPLGVQNTFVFTQGALHRRWAGALPAVMTASICDTFLIVMAVSGVSLAVLSIPWFEGVLGWVGAVFLLYMGWATWRSSPGDESMGDDLWPTRRQITFAASVSLLNPHAILDTIGVIGTSSLQYSGPERLAYAASCIIVSWLWFCGLAFAGRVFGTAAGTLRLRQWLNQISAVVMWALAALFLVKLLGA